MNVPIEKRPLRWLINCHNPEMWYSSLEKDTKTTRRLKAKSSLFDDYKIAQEIFSKIPLAHVVLFIRILEQKFQFPERLFSISIFLGLLQPLFFLCLYIDLWEDHHPISKSQTDWRICKRFGISDKTKKEHPLWGSYYHSRDINSCFSVGSIG